MKSKNRDVSSIIKGRGNSDQEHRFFLCGQARFRRGDYLPGERQFQDQGYTDLLNPVAVGDRVTVAGSAEDADYITAISPRRNYIIRRASNLSKESHILCR